MLLSSCYFTGNKRSRLASSLFSQLDRNGLRPHFRIWAGDQVYLDAPWYEFAIKSHSVAELEQLHSATYARTWFADQGLSSVLAQGANVFCTDDHELWNNAPHPSATARDTSDSTKRRAWQAMARALGQTFQGNTAKGQRFRVPPLDFFVLDTRVNRGECCDRLFSDAQWRELRAWAAEPSGLGVLVLGQPIFESASRRRGSFGDYRLADYERDYIELMDLLGRSTRSTTVLTGDVHFSRVTSVCLPDGREGTQRTAGHRVDQLAALAGGGRAIAVVVRRLGRGTGEGKPAGAAFVQRHDPAHRRSSAIRPPKARCCWSSIGADNRVFCTVSQWRLDDLDASRPSFRQEYFLGTRS